MLLNLLISHTCTIIDQAHVSHKASRLSDPEKEYHLELKCHYHESDSRTGSADSDVTQGLPQLRLILRAKMML